MKKETPGLYLKPSEFINSDHPAVKKFVAEKSGHLSSPEEEIEALYYAVRMVLDMTHTDWIFQKML